MHILFVIPPVEIGNRLWAIYPPLGIMYMSSLLKQEGHQVDYIDGTLDDYAALTFAQLVQAIHPDLIGISVNAYQMKYCREYVQKLPRQRPEHTRGHRRPLRLVCRGCHF